MLITTRRPWQTVATSFQVTSFQLSWGAPWFESSRATLEDLRALAGQRAEIPQYRRWKLSVAASGKGPDKT
jgi:hypothetical protein